MNNYNMFTLVFEASLGCQMNCQGCHIEKNGGRYPSLDEQQELERFLNDIEASGMEFGEMEIGPTDLMSASNRQEFFSPFTASLIQRFGLCTMQLSLVHPLEVTTKFVAETYGTLSQARKINVNTPIEIRHIYNEKYMRRINENIELLRLTWPSPLNEVSFTIVHGDHLLTNAGSKLNYEGLYQQIAKLDAAEIVRTNCVFHHGRQGIDQPEVGASYVRNFTEINRLFSEMLERNGGKARINQIPTHLVQEIHRIIEIVYRNGELYIRPILNGGLTIEHERFKIPKPWTVENFHVAIAEAHARNYEHAMTVDDCLSCEHINLCASRFAHDVLALTGSKKCIYLLKDYKPVVLDNFENYEATVERV